MKPRNKLEKFIVEQSKGTVDKLTEDHKRWAFNKLHSKFVTFSYKKKHHCMECNHVWDGNQTNTKILKTIDCPSCRQKLNVPKYGEKEACLNESLYFHLIEVINGIQVVSVFSTKKFFYRKKQTYHSVNQVAQHWILENGKTVVLSLKGTMGHGYYRDNWGFGSGLEIRKESYSQRNRLKINLVNLYPIKKFAKYIKKRGVRTSIHGIQPENLFRFMIQDNKIETLFKMNKFKEVDYCVEKGGGAQLTMKHWKSFLITVKNNYKIEDIGIWIDLLELLEFFGKDLKSPKYICPIDLHKVHDKYVDKKRRFNQEREIQELKNEMDSDNVVYQKEKSKYFSLKFSKDNIEIKPLKSVEQVFREGDDLSHCLFTNGYHNKPNSLLFSAKVDGKKVETIEYSISESKILQARGFGNNPSEHNSKVKELFNKNINQIVKIK